MTDPVRIKDIESAHRLPTTIDRADEYFRLAEQAATCHNETGSLAQRHIAEQLIARSEAERYSLPKGDAE